MKSPSTLCPAEHGSEMVKSHMVAGGIISPGLQKKKSVWGKKKQGTKKSECI